jgi:hypothetical protein
LGTLEGKVDALIARVPEYNEDLRVAFDRIRSLERRQAWTMGAAGVLSVAMPLLIQFVTAEMKHSTARMAAEEQRLR